MTGDRPVLLGLLLYLLIAVVPTVVLWVAMRLLPAVNASIEQRRGRRSPTGPSLESVVADLRRLRREVRHRPPPTRVRRVALLAAYDEALLDTCRVVGVDAPLATATGPDRVYARLMTEAAVEDAGIALDPPAGGAAAA